ncbi:MAG: HlyD family secretion protein [Omnitrophica WOR_2 bacterium]
MNTNRALLSILLIIVLAGGGFLVYKNYLAPAPQAIAQDATPTPTAAADMISAEGKVAPVRQVNLSFTRSGRVAEVLVKMGDKVNAGQALARLDTSVLEANLSQSQAALQTAQANLQAALIKEQQVADAAHAQDATSRSSQWTVSLPSDIEKPGWYFKKTEQITSTQKEVDSAKAALDTEVSNLNTVAKNASSADLLKAEQRLSDAQSAFLVAKDVLDRARSSGKKELQDQAQTLYDSSKSELDAAQTSYDQILTTQSASDVLEARARVAVAQERYDTALDRLNKLQTGDQSLEVKSAEEAVRQAEAAVSEAGAAVHATQAMIDEATLKAPSEGVLARVDLEAGEVTLPGNPAIVLADTSAWRVETTDLSENDVTALSPGMKVKVTLDAFPNRSFDGTVREIALMSEDTRGSVTYQAKVDFDPGDAQVRWGMTAYINVKRP